MRALADARRVRPRRPARHRRHRRRAPDLQRLDHGGADRRRRRLRAWPSTATARRRACRAPPTCSRRSARGSTSRPSAVARCIDEVGFGFMFAPAHHGATRYVVPVRKELAVRTIFNFLGPLTNPAGATRQLIGVSDPAYLERDRRRARAPGRDRALVVSSADGLDEMSDVARRPTSSRSTTARSRATTSRRRTSGSSCAPATPSPAATPDDNARDHARASSPARPGRARDLARAQRRRRDLRRRARATALRERRRGRRGGDRRRRARPRRSMRSWPLTAELAPA